MDEAEERPRRHDLALFLYDEHAGVLRVQMRPGALGLGALEP